ncbi:hypothetical protein [Neptunomonas antarctica]|uniref:DUF2157 domain-containing protein n=1 Tax=Neptunomonas antarctica TaxID=619304 RepID=A0A1N7KIT4_9GAMM|nr:hypothetical protein [Neptunomonas antarctica]SIS61518.1 hypothetical protein SAMN05421760_102481 [Neptunomonas antarctica]
MYTDEDLDFAVDKGVFTTTSVEEFRCLLASSKNSPSVDEENFRLIGGFNDIFIVIACALLLFSSLWVLKGINESLGFFVFTVLSWCLSEFFVLKRRMALPAIALLLSFIGGIFALAISFFSSTSEMSFIVATAIATLAAYFHWLRFNVPITIAVGTAAGIGVLVSASIALFPGAKDWLLVILFIGGLSAFVFAMYWDSSDTHRTTRRSDVAFWLHLLSAPLIIHPVFSSLGVLNGQENLVSMAVVIVLYLLMTSISIAIDRRAFMVSSLVYVLYALSSLIKTYGGVGYSFALTGVFIGGALLILSAYWHSVRENLVVKLPIQLRNHIPKVKTV